MIKTVNVFDLYHVKFKKSDVLHRIKKHANRNQYLHVGDDLWVRNPWASNVPYTDINSLTEVTDYSTLLRNELVNDRMKYPWIDSENIRSEKAIIISDGFDFEEKHIELAKMLSNVNVFVINGALIKWKSKTKQPNYYIINNPYKQAMYYLPKSTSVKCIASARTNYEFLQKYNGQKYKYYPVGDSRYCGLDSKDCTYRIDDYRNAICGAINLLGKFGVKKLMLAFCDEVFDDVRPGSIMGDNGKSYYPQQLKANNLIDGNLYWLSKSNGCKVVQNTAGPKLKTATHISLEETMNFFQEK